MIIERHIFGSVSGYKTLAKGRSLSPEECRVLESFSFGQPNSSEYLASLSKQVAFWIRPLGSRRRALTRVMPGPADDQGRATVLMITAIASVSDWNKVMLGDFSLLLGVKSLWHWDGQPELNPVELPIVSPPKISASGRSVDKILNLISYVENNASKQRSIVIRDSDVTADELRCLEMLIPPSVRGGTSMAYRSLNPRLGSTLNCIASGISLNRGVQLVDPAAAVERSLYARVLADAGLSGSGVDPSFVAGYGEFGRHRQSKDKSASAMASQPVIVVPAQQGRSKIAFLSGWIATVILLITLGIFWLQQDNIQKKNTATTQMLNEKLIVFSDAMEDLVAGYPLPVDADERKHALATLDDKVKDIQDGSVWLEDVNRRGEVMAEIESLLADAEKGNFNVLEKLDAALTRDRKVALLYADRVEVVRNAADVSRGLAEELGRTEPQLSSLSLTEMSEQAGILENSLGQLAALGFEDTAEYRRYRDKIDSIRQSINERRMANEAIIKDMIAVLEQVQLALGEGAVLDNLTKERSDLQNSRSNANVDSGEAQLAGIAFTIANKIEESGRTSGGKWICALPSDVDEVKEMLIAADPWIRECQKTLSVERNRPRTTDDEIRKIDEELGRIQEWLNNAKAIREFLPDTKQPSDDGTD